MTDLYDYNFKYRKRALIYRKLKTICRGWRNYKKIPIARAAIVVYVAMTALCIYEATIINPYLPVPLHLLSGLIVALAIVTAFLYFNGKPKNAERYEAAFVKLGLTDALKLPPEIIEIEHKGNSFDMYIVNVGMSLSEWQDKRAELETVLGVVIAKINVMRGSTIVVLSCVPASLAFREHSSVMVNPDKGLKLRIGYRADGDEFIEFDKTAHVLIGGATGSGKTVLLKTILAMFVHVDSEVYINDYKGGIDFPESVWSRTEIVTTHDDTIAMLEKVIFELEDRKRAFLLHGVKNILEYNSVSGILQMRRIVVASDEVAEMLDRTGRKEDKERIDKITELLSRIARLGRAYGIHLILATQRPDANVICGQIKNNLTYRACGRADKILSQIVIDSTAASEISSETPGRFITYTGEEFQAIKLSSYFFK